MKSRRVNPGQSRRRNGLADTIKVAGMGLVHVARVNERLNHLTGYLDRRHEAALLAAGAVAALAARGGCGSGVNLVTGPGPIAIAHQPSDVALNTGGWKGGGKVAAQRARHSPSSRCSPPGRPPASR
jgi:hypothetical protein